MLLCTQVEYMAELGCRATGKTESGTCRKDIETYSAVYMQVCIWRDLVTIVLQLLALMLAAYIWIAVGCCKPRYSEKQLSTSRKEASQKLEGTQGTHTPPVPFDGVLADPACCPQLSCPRKRCPKIKRSEQMQRTQPWPGTG